MEDFQQNALAHSLTLTSLAVKQMLQTSNPIDPADYINKVSQQSDGQLFLIKDGNNFFLDRPIPDTFNNLILKARESGSIQFLVSRTVISAAMPFNDGNGQTMVLIGTTPKLMRRPSVDEIQKKLENRFGLLHHPFASPFGFAGIGDVHNYRYRMFYSGTFTYQTD